MAKVRIYDLSKILGISNKELVDYLKDMKGIPIKSHSSSIDQVTANEVIVEFMRIKRGEKIERKPKPQPQQEAPAEPQQEKAPPKVEFKVKQEEKQIEEKSSPASEFKHEVVTEKPPVVEVPSSKKPESLSPNATVRPSQDKPPFAQQKSPQLTDKSQQDRPRQEKRFERPQVQKTPPQSGRSSDERTSTPQRSQGFRTGGSDRTTASERPNRQTRPPGSQGKTFDRTTSSPSPSQRGSRDLPPRSSSQGRFEGRSDQPVRSGHTPRSTRPAASDQTPRTDRPARTSDQTTRSSRPPFRGKDNKEVSKDRVGASRDKRSRELVVPAPPPELEINKTKSRRRRKKKTDIPEEVLGKSGSREKEVLEENLISPKKVIVPKLKEKKDITVKPAAQTRTRSFSSFYPGRRGHRRKSGKPPEVTKKESMVKWMELPDSLTLAELSRKLDIPANELIKQLMSQGIMATINQSLNFDLAAQLVKGYGFRIERKKEEPEKAQDELDDPRLLSPRPPVVTILGHVDHGKTSLLDCIRKTDVAATESGGITQSIGAYTVEVDNKKIVFLDTPGHEAFTQMRARGARVTDIAVLVVAADDGVMPQTVEAINHAKAAGVPIIAAINKIDKPQANTERVKQQLAEYDLISEDWGGDVVTVPVSALTKTGIDELLEMILLVADMHEFKANPRRLATGVIIESYMDVGLGPVATVVVQNGTLRVGDVALVGNEWGRIKAMQNDKGRSIKKASPSMPAKIIGLSGVPQAGDYLEVMEEEKEAKEVSENRTEKQRNERLESVTRISLDDLFRQMKDGEAKDLNVVLKADVQGSVEALRHSLVRLTNENVTINIIHGGVGAINKSDVMLAEASNAIIIGFNVRPDPIATRLAEQEKVDIRLYRVIYHVIEDIRAAMVGLLEPKYEEVLLGRAEVRTIFKISRIGIISGCYITEGKIIRGSNARVIRDGIVVHEGRIDSLRRFKDDVKEVETNFECGIGIDKFGGFQPGDIIEAFTQQEVKQEIPEESYSR